MKKRPFIVIIAIFTLICILAACAAPDQAASDPGTSGNNASSDPETETVDPGTDGKDSQSPDEESADGPEEGDTQSPGFEADSPALTEDDIRSITDPIEFVSLYIKALREGDADSANLLRGEKRFDTLAADKSLAKDPYAETDGVNRLIPVEDGYIVCEAVNGSDVYFVREGDCIGYAVYVRDTCDRFVVEAVGKYAYEFAISDAEEYLRFPYFYDFKVYLDTGLHGNYFWSEEGTSDYSYPKDLLADVIACTLGKGDFQSLKHLYGDFSAGSSSSGSSENGEPVIVTSSAPFGFSTWI